MAHPLLQALRSIQAGTLRVYLPDKTEIFYLGANPGVHASLRIDDWRTLEYAAYLHHWDVDAIYLGRVDQAALDNLKAKEEHAIETGDFEPRTLYVVDVATALRIRPQLQPGDLLAAVDRHIVFARGAAPLVEGLGIANDLGMND